MTDSDTDTNLSGYYAATRETSVLAQSEQLAAAEQPFDHPLYGTLLDLENLRPDLVGATVVALSGPRQKIAVASGTIVSLFVPDDATMLPAISIPVTRRTIVIKRFADGTILNPGDVLTLTDPTPLPLMADGSIPDWSGSIPEPHVKHM